MYYIQHHTGDEGRKVNLRPALSLNIDLAVEGLLTGPVVERAVSKHLLNIFYMPGSAPTPTQHEI